MTLPTISTSLRSLTMDELAELQRQRLLAIKERDEARALYRTAIGVLRHCLPPYGGEPGRQAEPIIGWEAYCEEALAHDRRSRRQEEPR